MVNVCKKGYYYPVQTNDSWSTVVFYSAGANNYYVYDCFYMTGLKSADIIIAQVPRHQRLLKENWNIDSRLVLSPYFEIERTKSSEKEFVLWVGRAAYYKRPDLFVKLARAFPDQKFVMICNKSKYDKGFIKDMENKADDLKNFEFHEYVPYPEMETYYKRAKFLVNTSDYEGFSNTFIEAAVQYTPVLSLNSDPNNMLSSHGGGIICNGNFSILKEQCNMMLKNKDLVLEAGINAFEYAFRYHRLDRAVEQIDKIFTSI